MRLLHWLRQDWDFLPRSWTTWGSIFPRTVPHNKRSFLYTYNERCMHCTWIHTGTLDLNKTHVAPQWALAQATHLPMSSLAIFGQECSSVFNKRRMLRAPLLMPSLLIMVQTCLADRFPLAPHPRSSWAHVGWMTFAWLSVQTMGSPFWGKPAVQQDFWLINASATPCSQIWLQAKLKSCSPSGAKEQGSCERLIMDPSLHVSWRLLVSMTHTRFNWWDNICTWDASFIIVEIFVKKSEGELHLPIRLLQNIARCSFTTPPLPFRKGSNCSGV